MKKTICTATVLMMTAGLTMHVSAENRNSIVSAESVFTEDLGQVIIPVKITGNPGFHNFAIALDYDREQLELININISDEDNTYLCGTITSINTSWEDEDEKIYGYITGASAEKVTEDGILFTATFDLKDDFDGTAEVTPIVKYMRSCTEETTVFEEEVVSVQSGTITLNASGTEDVLPGDFDGNGEIDVMDITHAIVAYQNQDDLTEAQKAAIDTDGDGKVGIMDITDLIIKYQNQ